MQSRKIIRNRAIAEDNFRFVTEAEDLSKGGDIIVSQELWEAHKSDLINFEGRVGVQLGGDAEPDVVADDLQHLAVIAINFPVFKDGRGYSLARILRERHGFKGELRATGDVLRDQMFYMQRCGFDAFEPRADRCINEALKGLSDFSVTYQADVHDKRPIYHRRSNLVDRLAG